MVGLAFDLDQWRQSGPRIGCFSGQSENYFSGAWAGVCACAYVHTWRVRGPIASIHLTSYIWIIYLSTYRSIHPYINPPIRPAVDLMRARAPADTEHNLPTQFRIGAFPLMNVEQCAWEKWHLATFHYQIRNRISRHSQNLRSHISVVMCWRTKCAPIPLSNFRRRRRKMGKR